MVSIKSELSETDLLSQQILYVDGLTRVGKSMVNLILSSLSKVSHPQFIEPLEQLMPMYTSGHITRNALSSFLRLHLNERFYNFALSRNLNFRYSDLTSIHNSKSPTEFLKNLSLNDGDAVINHIRESETILQFQTHDLLTHYDSFLDLRIGGKVIELFRDPVETIHSWYKRGWGTRFDSEDPRSFTSLFKCAEGTLPHYVLGYEHEYFKLNPMEKCVFMHNLLLKKSCEQYLKLNQKEKNNILLLRYEDILVDPNNELLTICRFLNCEVTSHTVQALSNARLPRKIDPSLRDLKLLDIKNAVKSCLYEDLLETSQHYVTNFYELRN